MAFGQPAAAGSGAEAGLVGEGEISQRLPLVVPA
jgi:hypothetical protein